MRTKTFALALVLITSQIPRSLPVFSERITLPRIFAKSAITVDVDSREIIFAKNIHTRKYPASTTKIVTAILLARHKEKGEMLFYSEDARNEYPYVLRFNAQDRLAASQAMDALLLFSGNDIAHMIAENVSGTTSAFADLMNGFASELGLHETRFVNSTGLHDPDHYTTAYELSVIARKMYDYDWILRSSGKPSAIVQTEFGEPVLVRNRNKLVGKNGCVAGKTGWTPEAGRCLVALYEREGRRIAGVVMDSLYLPGDTAAFQDMEAIIDYSIAAKKKPILERGGLGQTIPIEFKIFFLIGPEERIDLPLATKDDIECYTTGGKLFKHIRLSEINPWNLDKHKSIGSISLNEPEVSHSVPLYPAISTTELAARNAFAYIAAGFMLFLTGIIVLFIVRLSGKRRNHRSI